MKAQVIPGVLGFTESCVVHLKGELEVWSVEPEQMRNS